MKLTSDDASALAVPGAEPQVHRGDERVAIRTLAVLRVLLLPIVFAGDHLVAHPTVGTRHFDLAFALACAYAALALFDSWRPSGPVVPVGGLLVVDLLVVGALTFESGGAFSQLHAAFLALPLAAALLLDPGRTAAVSVLTGLIYLLVALVHPATHGTKRLDVTLAQGLYVVWFGTAAVLLSTLLSRRAQRILELAAARGGLVAQAVEAEERTRKDLSDDLHDHAIQNVVTARQDLADARAGDDEALERAEHALLLALEQLRSAVRELHPYLLDHLDLPSALETIAEQYAARGEYTVQIALDPAAIGVHDHLVMSLARELLANIAAHAHATHATIRLTRSDHSVMLEVSDDGRGFTAEQQLAALRAGHIGLASSRERVAATGGSFHVVTEAGKGSTVQCSLCSPALKTRRGRVPTFSG